jgi:hypothetical protein
LCVLVSRWRSDLGDIATAVQVEGESTAVVGAGLARRDMLTRAGMPIDGRPADGCVAPTDTWRAGDNVSPYGDHVTMRFHVRIKTRLVRWSHRFIRSLVGTPLDDKPLASHPRPNDEVLRAQRQISTWQFETDLILTFDQFDIEVACPACGRLTWAPAVAASPPPGEPRATDTICPGGALWVVVDHVSEDPNRFGVGAVVARWWRLDRRWLDRVALPLENDHLGESVAGANLQRNATRFVAPFLR